MATIDLIVTPVVLLAFWGLTAFLDRMRKRVAKLESMSDDELLDAMNFAGPYDSVHRREYTRRHPHGACGIKI